MSDETPEPEETTAEQAEQVSPEPAAEPAAEADTAAAEPVAEADAGTEAEAAAADAEEQPAAEPVAEAEADVDAGAADEADEEPPAPREKPAIPGMDLDVDLVLDGEGESDRWSEDEDPHAGSDSDAADEDLLQEPIAATIQLSADARYRATGKRKTAIARVTLKPGTGTYTVNGRALEEFFPRETLQRTIRQPLETVGYEDKVDVIARMHGGGVSAQAGALRHGISRALLEADPNLRTDLKKRGFLTRDARAKERKKAGLKKARKRPQFSKR